MKGDRESHVSGFSHKKAGVPQRLTRDLGFRESHKEGISSGSVTQEKVFQKLLTKSLDKVTLSHMIRSLGLRLQNQSHLSCQDPADSIVK